MHDVVLLAGGRSRRMAPRPGDPATDKMLLRDGHGRSLLAVAIAGALATSPAAVIVVGPRRPDAAESPPAVRWCREDPPGGGPVAAMAAGLAEGTSPVVAVAAADAPAASRAVPHLLAVAARGTAAVLLDAGGRRSLCLAATRTDLLAGIDALDGPGGASVGRLLAALAAGGVRVVEVSDRWGAADDIDTPDDAVRRGWRA